MWLSSAPPPSTASSEPRNGINISGGNGNSGVPSTEDFSRQAYLSAELSKKVINMKELRSLALQSFSDSPGIRSTVWKELNNTPLRAERSQEATVYVGNLDPQVMLKNWSSSDIKVDFLCEEDIGYAIKVLNMIKLHGKPIRVNKASQDKKIIDVGCLWKQLKQWLIFTLLPKAAH
ncbi:hypothetical protein HID58_065828 [Brassica napus]|uniref:RRM domain-containing protein n=1 Tax=Brassica napus TaxID=3708 RepID=A0ABQ7ZDX9_BRANA|nr:hypothetical protein HID58_065828 [Brassica napus]